MKANINLSIIIRVCAILLVLLLAWCFSNLILYVFLAFIFSLIGKPVARKICCVKIFRFYIPYGIGALLTMIGFILFFTLILLFFVPMLTREAQIIARIDYDELSLNLSYLLDSVQNFLYSNSLMDEDKTLVEIVTEEIRNFANLTNFSNILGEVVSVTSSFLIGLFAVFFLTFFFIKDDIRFDSLAKLLLGEQHAIRLSVVSDKITSLLSRYFIGLLFEIASMITLLYVGMAIFGIKGALLMAFFGGILNAIPYLGPLIGILCSCLFGTVECLSLNEYHAILPTVFKIASTFVGANLIDNIVLQPVIYSQSVKAHPVEIFLVIIMGGSLAGIMGMLFAIPVYTMIRTIVIELFRYVKTENHEVQET